ncbi:mRNA turnover and ribosome assembly protein [Coemansia sp. RSA 1722]|nr:mRNA turnover and ribosome assembly protein [Coemansia sp. RSA 1722]
MPRAKRSKVVSLTKVKSKGREGRAEVMREVEEAASTYDYVWVFSVHNMRNQYLKTVRNDFKTSRFFFGSNRVIAKALGKDPESEIRPNMHKIGNALVGEVGLLFTNESPDAVKKAFGSFEADDYPRSGTIATYKVVVSSGEVVRGYTKETFPNNMEPELRELGMPTLLQNGKITISSDYVICEDGDKLTPNQCRLLKHFWEKMAVFKINLICHLNRNGDFVQLVENGSADSDSDSDNDKEMK